MPVRWTLETDLASHVVELVLAGVDEADLRALDGEPPLRIDQVLALGVAFVLDGELVAWPGCCADLELLGTLDDTEIGASSSGWATTRAVSTSSRSTT